MLRPGAMLYLDLHPTDDCEKLAGTRQSTLNYTLNASVSQITVDRSLSQMLIIPIPEDDLVVLKNTGWAAAAQQTGIGKADTPLG